MMFVYKKCASDDPFACGFCLIFMIASLGGQVVKSKIHSLKIKGAV